MIKTGGLKLPAGHIVDIQTGYKYLDILRSHGNHDEETRKTTTSKYSTPSPMSSDCTLAGKRVDGA